MTNGEDFTLRKSARMSKFEIEAKKRIGEAHWKILTAVSNGRLVSHGRSVTRACGNPFKSYSGGRDVQRSRPDSGSTSGNGKALG